MPTAATQWVTLAFILAVTVVVIGYDVLAIHAWGYHASISRVVRHLAAASPTFFVALVFWVGVLIGHIFLPCE